ncbi:putative FKBP-type peptidyl-prolyl cis-trans isomerase [Maioricimonas rarisocia]|uniref:peptidylprolyl isomerase n=2 Tax=Maioricimonas rarisocia TaxID=2528026 RepID=A0A517Z9H7_9PLAN|nr:putative FKBP-type peptidyl-prolyl cis-trans isomerase [Maioricimonas rarisocia]
MFNASRTRILTWTVAASLCTAGAAIPVRAQSPNATPGGADQVRTAAATVATQAPSFEMMTNGRDLSGWVVHEGKEASWAYENQVVSCVAPGAGWLRSEQAFSDFILRFEYRLSEGANSGVAVRFPGEGSPSATGIEIQLIDDASKKYRDLQPTQYTGSLYYQVPPAKKGAAYGAGRWNACEISCIGPRIRVTINGQVVNDVWLDQLGQKESRVRPLAERPPMGYVGLQSHRNRVDFRALRILDLSRVTPSGLRYVDMIAGSGDPIPEGATVTVHYVGHLSDGTQFDSSHRRGEPITVPLGEVIAGWKEGIPGMRVGGRRRLIIPPSLAYGRTGVKDIIPPDATLVFDIEVEGFEAVRKTNGSGPQ